VTVPDETYLVQRAQANDREAYARLVQHYWDRLYRWLYRLCHDQHTAEDLTQEVFLKALAKIATFQAGTSFQAWLFRIGHNLFINLRRSKHSVRISFPEEIATPGEGPVEELLNRESMKLLARAVGRLPAEFRAPFLLRVEQDLSYREIADVLGLTEDTARWRVFKAREKLMETLAGQLETEKEKRPASS
jgi:RNA polymerase sigma-70 factor (ECF subfamily)